MSSSEYAQSSVVLDSGRLESPEVAVADRVSASSTAKLRESASASTVSCDGATLGTPSSSSDQASQRPSCLSRAFWHQLFLFLGPGFLVATGYIDPGNLAADINQGVQAGYSLTWVTLWCTAMGYVIQIVAAKLGVVTGRHLAEHGGTEFPVFARIALWMVSELGIIAVDMIEVMGGAVGLQALSSGGIPLWAGVLITGAGGFAVLLLERWGMRLLEAVLMILIAVMAITFGYMFFSTGVDYGAVAKGLFVPRLDSNTIQLAVGAVGALITPHNLYLHSALVLKHSKALQSTSMQQSMRYIRIEAALALLTALGINIFIIGVFAHSFSTESGSSIVDVGLGNAGQSLAQLYGKQLQYIWGVGLLAAAFASTVTSTYAGQVIMTGYLGVQVSTWWRTAAVRLFTLGPTLSVALVVRSESAMTSWTEVLNVIQSLVLPFVVIPLMLFTSSKRIMGPHANRPWSVVALVLVLAFLIGMNGYLVVSFAVNTIPDAAWARSLFSIGCILYGLFVMYLLVGPHRVHTLASKGVQKVKGLVLKNPPPSSDSGNCPPNEVQC